MKPSTLRRLLIFAVPAVILIAAYLLKHYTIFVLPARQEMIKLAPYLFLSLGIYLSLHFHRGRPLYALLLILAFFQCYKQFIIGNISSLTSQTYFQAFALMIPLNMTFFTIIRERGIFSTAGRLRAVFLAFEIASSYMIFRYHFVDIESLLNHRILNMGILDRLLTPQPALFITIFSFLFISTIAIIRQSPVDSGLSGALVALFISCNSISSHETTAVFISASALIISLSLLQDSYNMAFRDDLTKIPSRRALNEAIYGLGRKYAVAMVDIDHFKNFNDTYGHDVGDQVLRLVAKMLLEVEGGGKAYRYGGEEFTIIFSNKNAEETIEHLERVRAKIADYKVVIRGNDRPKDQKSGKNRRGNSDKDIVTSVTISIGVADSTEKVETAAEVIKAADKALYKAKNRGRNQVCKS